MWRTCVTYLVETVLMIGSVKMLQTSHVVFVDNLVEEFIDIFDRERTDGRSIHGFSGIWLALGKHPKKNVIVHAGSDLLSKMGPRLTDIGSLKEIEHFLPGGSLPPFFRENAFQWHFHVGVQS